MVVHFFVVKLKKIFLGVDYSYGASDGYPSQHGITRDAQVYFPFYVFLQRFMWYKTPWRIYDLMF